jgi:hypothetical protein
MSKGRQNRNILPQIVWILQQMSFTFAPDLGQNVCCLSHVKERRSLL